MKILFLNPNRFSGSDGWRSGYRDAWKIFFLNPERFAVNVGWRSWDKDALNMFIGIADSSTSRS